MEQFGKYTLIRKIGTGGMAEVFLARTTVAQGLNKTLVIKKIHTAYARSRQFVTMFVDEAKIALGLNHPNIIQVFDFGAVGDTYFLAMEYVEGMDLLRLLRTELLVVLGTSSSETAIPGMMEKLRKAGVGRAVAGLVIPSGYSFNLDGVALTLPLSTMFVAQVYGIELSAGQQLSLFVVMLFTSKGAAGVTGGAFAALAATVIAAGLPAEGLALLLGIDRFMSLARAITNTIGNAVAAIVVAKWDGEFNREDWAQSAAQIQAVK